MLWFAFCVHCVTLGKADRVKHVTNLNANGNIPIKNVCTTDNKNEVEDAAHSVLQ